MNFIAQLSLNEAKNEKDLIKNAMAVNNITSRRNF